MGGDGDCPPRPKISSPRNLASPNVNRIRSHSLSNPEMPVHHADGLQYLLYRLKKVAGEDGYVQEDDFVKTVEEVVMEDHHDHRIPLEEQHAQLHEVFCAFDHDNSGKALLSELRCGLQVILSGTEHERIRFAFRGLDLNGNGKVTETEFLDFFRHYFSAKTSLATKNTGKLPEERWKVITEHLLTCFRASDKDRNGTIDYQEFMEAAQRDPDHPFCLILDSMAIVSSHIRSPPTRPLPARNFN